MSAKNSSIRSEIHFLTSHLKLKQVDFLLRCVILGRRADLADPPRRRKA